MFLRSYTTPTSDIRETLKEVETVESVLNWICQADQLFNLTQSIKDGFQSKKHTDCQRKNRYVQIVCHTHINQATSLKFSGPVHHLMEQLMYKFHFYISNGIAFIPPFVTYPNFCIPTMKEKVHFNSIKLNTKKWLWNW